MAYPQGSSLLLGILRHFQYLWHQRPVEIGHVRLGPTQYLRIEILSPFSAFTCVVSRWKSDKTNTIVNATVTFKEMWTRSGKRTTALLPENIINYRDGGGESEFNAIHNKEGQAPRQLCLGSGQKIKITSNMAINRHQMRFFCCDEPLATKLG